jgi:hypothetical protein
MALKTSKTPVSLLVGGKMLLPRMHTLATCHHTGIHSSDMDVWGSWRMPALYVAIEQEHQDLHNNISKECGPLGNAAQHCYPYAYFHSLRHCSREFLHVAICMPCVPCVYGYRIAAQG